MSTQPLKLTRCAARAERRGRCADPWRTLAAWLWTAYAAGVAAFAVWFFGR